MMPGSICASFFRASSRCWALIWARWATCEEVLKHVFAGKLKPVVDRTFPLAETRAAHEYLAASEMFGKVVLTV